jgi:hypothetical protein
MSREQALKAANLIADDFKVGFCDSQMVDLFADRIEEVYGNDNAMSLRDLFATQALAGLLATKNYSIYSCDLASEHSYKIADAMIEARGES